MTITDYIVLGLVTVVIIIMVYRLYFSKKGSGGCHSSGCGCGESANEGKGCGCPHDGNG